VMCIEVTTYHHKDLRCGASFFVRHAKVICLELLERHAADVTCPWLFWLHFALADFDPSEGAKVKVEIARLGKRLPNVEIAMVKVA
jgi:hypothetical protein